MNKYVICIGIIIDKICRGETNDFVSDQYFLLMTIVLELSVYFKYFLWCIVCISIVLDRDQILFIVTHLIYFLFFVTHVPVYALVSEIKFIHSFIRGKEESDGVKCHQDMTSRESWAQTVVRRFPLIDQ